MICADLNGQGYLISRTQSNTCPKLVLSGLQAVKHLKISLLYTHRSPASLL